MPEPKPEKTKPSVPAKGFAWVTGPVARWVVIGAWLVAMGLTIGLNLPGKLADSEENEARNYLPASAESTKAFEVVNKIVKSDNLPFVAVVHRDGGLTAADQAAIKAQLKTFNATPVDEPITVTDADKEKTGPNKGKLPTTTLDGVLPVGPQKQYLYLSNTAEDGTSALIVGAVRSSTDSEELLDRIDALRSGVIPLKKDGLTVKVTGAAGFSYDGIKIFANLNATLLLAALALVITLLILIYRSPILFLLPLFSVIFAEAVSRGIGYLTTDIGVVPTGQSTSIMSILVLGAGTDYALLVTSRYREELRHHTNRHDALRLSMASSGPAVLASGLTVAAGLLTLSLASVAGTAGLGPLGAIGVAVAMIAMLTFLPALFAVVPRGIFWPKVPKPGSVGADATHGFWRRIGDRIVLRPRRTWVITGILLLICAAGLSQYSTQVSQNDSFIGDIESVKGGELLSKSFPGGTSAPVQVIVPQSAKVAAVVSKLKANPNVADVAVTGTGDGGKTLVAATLKEDPYSSAAQDTIGSVRDDAKAAGGAAVLVGGDTAINYDLAKANNRDLRLIIPIVLLVVFVILIALLRAVVFPLVLIVTVVVSFAAAMGISTLVWQHIFGFAGADSSILLLAFVFLVALGIDYNIFLASRIREEAVKYGTKQGILRGLGATGGVITAAGIVLAGTFIVLATTPLVFLVESGTAVAIGVLLDTFIVRSILTPALSFDIGHGIWWPWGSKIPLDEDAPEPTTPEPPSSVAHEVAPEAGA